VLLQTGLRIGECAALDYEDLPVGERSGSVFVRGAKGTRPGPCTSTPPPARR
jgi:integrase